MKYVHNMTAPVRLKKNLITPAEKAEMLATMRSQVRTAEYWSFSFRRLTSTIRKFAAEAGIELAKR